MRHASHASHAAHSWRGVRLAHSRRQRVAAIAVGGVVLVAGVAVGVDALLHSRLFAASHVVVTGARHESTYEIERAAGLLDAPPMINVNPSTIASRLEASFTWISGVRVSMSWPHTVAIDVTERVPVAEIKTQGRRHPLELVDATGRRLGPIGRQHLPLLIYAAPRALQRRPILPAAATPGLIVAATLPHAFAWQVKVIRVDAQGWVTLTLHNPVSYELGPANDLGAKYEDVASVIASTTLHAGDVVDVSEPQAMTVTGP